ncbi:MAG: glycosyltransferase [Rhodocyclaceae bacterium]|nr:glycosyltransferase [Rhodocyclaceae bacterium]
MKALDLPLVSVVIPVRNGKEYIDEALHSVLAQDYGNLEIIVVDDGSTDDDYDRLAQIDPCIRVVHLEGRGVSFARNTGMRQSGGRYIAFLDADDIWFPGKLAAQIRYLERHPDVGVIFGGFLKWTSDDSGHFPPASALSSDCSHLERANPERSGWLYHRLLMGLLVGMNTAVIRREIYEWLGGFREDMRIGEDYDFWLRASRTTQMHALDGDVALYRIHAQSAMHKLDDENYLGRLLLNTVERYSLNNLDGSLLKEKTFHRRVAMTYFNHGYAHYWHGKIAVARRAFAYSLRHGGRRLRSGVYWLLSRLKRTQTS